MAYTISTKQLENTSKNTELVLIKPPIHQTPIMALLDNNNDSVGPQDATEIPKLSGVQKCCTFIKENKYLFIMVITITIATTIFMLPAVSLAIKVFLLRNLDYIFELQKNHFIAINSVLAVISFFSIFFIPNTLISLIIGFMCLNFWVAFALNIIPITLSVVTSFFAVKKFFYENFQNSYKDSNRFIIITEIIKDNHWKASFFLWVFWVPLPLKLALIPLTELRFFPYIIMFIQTHPIRTYFFTMIGAELQILIKKGFNQYWVLHADTPTNKLKYIISIFFLC